MIMKSATFVIAWVNESVVMWILWDEEIYDRLL